MKIFNAVFLLFFSFYAQSQSIEKSAFIDSLNTLNTIQEVSVAKELSNGNFVFVTASFKLFGSSKELIILVDAEGNTLHTFSPQVDTTLVFKKLMSMSITETDSQLIFSQACLTQPDKIPAILYYITDKQLNLFHTGIHHVETEPEQDYQVFDHLSPLVSQHPDGGFYALLPANNFHPDAGDELGLRTYFRLDNGFNLMRSKTYRTKRENGASNLVYNPTSFSYFSGSVDGTTYIVDSSFNEIKRTASFLNKNPDEREVLDSRSALKTLNNSYLLTGTYAEPIKLFPNKPIDSAYYNYSFILVKKYNQNFELIDSLCLNPILADSGNQFSALGWDKYGAAMQGVDFKDNNRLFFTYFDATCYLLSGQENGSYSLFLTDSMFNIIWAKKVSLTDRMFKLYYIMATQDGGCLVTGVRQASEMQASIYIAKHNALGERTWVYNEAKPQTAISVYPNPANNILFADKIPTNASIVFYSIDGKKVLETQPSNTQPIDISTLQNGLYFYSIQSQNHTQLKSGKLVIQH